MLRRWIDGVSLSLSWLTVLPARGPHDIDRTVASRAITAAPVAGLVLGAAAAAVSWVARRASTCQSGGRVGSSGQRSQEE